jgi:glutamate carboxypeptidase
VHRRHGRMVGAIRNELLAAEPEMLAAIGALAAIDSGSYDAAGVARVADAVGALLAERGFAMTLQPVAGRGPQLTASLAVGDGPRVLVAGHSDTVWPAGTAASWPVRRDGDMLSGPGVGDMKGSLVMAAFAIDAARRAGGLDGLGAIEVLVVPDEELGSPDSRAWIEDRARAAAACLGLEAGWPGGGVVVARGAVGAVVVRAHGQTAHAAGHEGEGASAVAALAPLVAEIEACSDPDHGTRATVGIFRGGEARQVVPGEAELHVDLRAPDAPSADALLASVRERVAAASSGALRVELEEAVERPATAAEGGIAQPTISTGAVRFELEGGITRPAFPAAASDALWNLAAARAAELGIALQRVTSRGGSDASFAAALGVPTIDGLGPICHDSCARGERIEIGSLADRGALFAGLLSDLRDFSPTVVGNMP